MTKIVLPFPPSTNNLFFTTKYGRARTQRYDSWIMEAGNEILRQRPKKITGPVHLLFEIERKRDGRKRDASNFIKAPEDLLVSHRIIEADDDSIVYSVKSAWSDEVEGCRITIESIFSSVPVASASPSASQDGQAIDPSKNADPHRGL